MMKKSRRLRNVGALVLMLGIVGAGLFYWSQTGPVDALEDVLPGYERAETREIGIQMGATGVILLEWRKTLGTPGAEAIMIAGGTALFAAYFFRVAWVLDEEERDRARLTQEPPDPPAARS
jgi:hypothetical protein